MPPKRKSQGRFKDLDDDTELPFDGLPSVGHVEQHTTYRHRQGKDLVDAESTLYRLPPSPVKKARTVDHVPFDTEPPPLDLLQDNPTEGLWTEAEAGRPQGSQRPLYPSDNPLLVFVRSIDQFVEEMLRLDAPCPQDMRCQACDRSLGNDCFRCKDCAVGAMWCKECVAPAHSLNFLHRLEQFNGSFFERRSLKSMGLRVQLGHCPGESCHMPVSAPNDDFVVIDSDGIHEIGLDYCGCEKTAPWVTQLLRARLFPATTVGPKTAATFRVLETYQMLSHTGRLSGHEFMIALQRRSDNTRPADVRARYPSFMRMVHEWRHLRMLKRSGRGHDPGGVAGTGPGECALLCPACPQLHINMEPALEEDEEWKDAVFVAVDANFRLARKDVSSDDDDPGLNHGTAYVVDTAKFQAFLDKFQNKIIEDKSTCNNHDAIKLAGMGRGKGLAATGMGTAQCSRHDMKRPTSCGDLQKGERYVNMDFFVMSSLEHHVPRPIRISYDIACQWHIKLAERTGIYPPNVFSNAAEHDLTFLVPKFHLPAHIQACQLMFSHNLIPRVGRTDGEAPERGWAKTNRLSYSTREMGPGSRRDTMDDEFGDMNWVKYVDLGDQLSRRAVEAEESRTTQVEAFKLFGGALDRNLVVRWTTMAKDWEEDRRKPNPYAPSNKVLTAAQVRLQLAEDDQKALGGASQLPSAHVGHNVITASMFINQGIELEELRRLHAIDLKNIGPHSTDLQRSKVIERSNGLQRKFDAWVDIQAVYMPSVGPFRRATNSVGTISGTSATIHDVRFLLPSEALGLVSVDDALAGHEFKFRIAQAYSVLADLRGLLLMRSHLMNSKARLSYGTKMTTRSQALIQNASTRIGDTADKYRATYKAICALEGRVGDSAQMASAFKPLDPSEVTGLKSMEDGREGYKKLSWIWHVRGLGETEDEATENALRVEFCRARARAHRWQEECLLLAEEMRRTMRFWEWDARRWEDRAAMYSPQHLSSIKIPEEDIDYPGVVKRAHDMAAVVYAGKVAYALRQAAGRRALLSAAKEKFDVLIKRLDTDNGKSKFVEIV